MIAIIASQFNKDISERLIAGAKKALEEAGISVEKYRVIEVPGAFEIPYMAQKIIGEKKYKGIIALGCVIEGETDHYRAVCDGVTYGIQKVSIENGVPIMFGILMCKNSNQAWERCGDNKNKGFECAESLLALLK